MKRPPRRGVADRRRALGRPFLSVAVAAGLVLAIPHMPHAADGTLRSGLDADGQPAIPAEAGAADTARTYRLELEAVAAQRSQSVEKRKQLEGEIRRLKIDQDNIQSALVRAADQTRALNRLIDSGERRLRELLESEAGLQKTLSARRTELAGILATLQRIGRHPPPAIVARPSDALGAIRSAILLGAVMPRIRGQTEDLQRDLAALTSVRRDIERERAGLKADAEQFARENARLELLLAEKSGLQSRSVAALALENKRSAELAERADSLKDLIAGSIPETAAGSPDAPGGAGTAAPRPPASLFQTVPFSQAAGTVRLPADGTVVRTFGEVNSLGEASDGLSLRVSARNRVYAPFDAKVAYAGPFRSYGQVLILDVGEGYHVVLSGLERIDVGRDQLVLAGEPVGRMGTMRYASAGTIDIHTAEPVLYIELRKDGGAIDPSPWWATPGAEKVGG